jgi:hypothetical protein
MNTIIDNEPYTPATLKAAVAAVAGIKKFASDSEISRLRNIQAELERTEKVRLDHSVNEAIAAEHSQEPALREAMNNGEHAKGEQVFDRHQMKEFYRRHRRAAKQNLRALTAEALPLCQQILERFADATGKLAARLEKEEREQHAAFAIAYQPSLLIRTLQGISKNIVFQRLPFTQAVGNHPVLITNATVSPATMLQGIIDL